MSEVLVILGSKSDASVGDEAIQMLRRFGVTAEMAVASAHRTPDRVKKLVLGSEAKIFIAVAGLSAALPGAIASITIRPVIGVPVSGKVNIDSILSIVQMPPGIPVAAVGLDRGDNAAILAVEILAIGDESIRRKLEEYRKEMADQVERDSEEMHK